MAKDADLIISLPLAGKIARPMASLPVSGIFILLLLAAIWLARDLLIPVTVAFLLFFAGSPLRRRLGRWGIPNWASAVLVSAAVLAGALGIGTIVAGQAGGILSELPTISSRLDEKFQTIRAKVVDLRNVAKRIDQAATPAVETGAIATQEKGASVVMNVLGATPAALGQVFATVLLLFFLICSADLFYLKIVQSFDHIREKREAYAALRQIEASLGNYFATIFAINAGLGMVIAAVFWALGMPAPLLFGVAAFLLNFIPYVGIFIGAGLSTAVALVSLDGFFWPAMVGGSYLLANSIENNAVTPLFLSRKLELNMVVVFLAVALWAWLWSFLGMIVAVPLLVVARVLCEHVPGWEKFGNFLAGQALPLVDEEEAPPAAIVAPLGTASGDLGDKTA